MYSMLLLSLKLWNFTFLGKSDKLIKHKLKEICDRQKMREKTMKWRPFFSHLLQSRAALLQTTTPQSQQRTTPLLQPDFYVAPSQANPHTTAAQNGVHQTTMPHSLPQAVTASPPQAENQPVASVNGGQHQPGSEGQTECLPQAPSVAASLEVSAAQDGASPVSTPNSNNPSAPSPQPFTLPLIRSKTGRIILPSSLKPSRLRHPAVAMI